MIAVFEEIKRAVANYTYIRFDKAFQNSYVVSPPITANTIHNI